jgi:Eco57I restriction-modification methylase
MATLARELRKELEKTAARARDKAEAGARKALEEYAVHEAEPYGFMDRQRQELRDRLRERGLQAGDARAKDGFQTIQHLCAEFGYEHWHRMLFARFLAENNLLIQPGSKMPISFEECRELAKDENKDWLALASEYSQRMLPAIFRPDDPVLELSLPMESRNQLESWLKELPTEVFLADDSLGWVYQFWQANEKERVNKSGVKIGEDEIAPVTQLFTEDYMVLFLLHNTLGAWWAGKRKAEGKSHKLPDYEWTHLRFKDDGTPAAGAFEGWPTLARDLKVLDPCMGSGHFLVFALHILVAFRMEEEGLSKREAISAVLQDNLAGLEIDPRCAQIAAFNLALTAWKMADGHFQLPKINLACSGLGIHAKEEDWVKLAGEDSLLRETMKELYQLFKQAPILGSLIDPKRVGGHLFAANFEKARPLLEQALTAEHQNVAERELAVVAAGLLSTTRILYENFTLVATNVPYLGYGRQSDTLKEYCARFFPMGKADLATCFIERCTRFASQQCTTAIVTPQNWLFLSSYRHLRSALLAQIEWNLVIRLGSGAFETISGEVVNVVLLGLTNKTASTDHEYFGLDCSHITATSGKAKLLAEGAQVWVSQADQQKNPDSRIGLSKSSNIPLLSNFAESYWGLGSGDGERFCCQFWEIPKQTNAWEFLQVTFAPGATTAGKQQIVFWEQGHGSLYELAEASKEKLKNIWRRGHEAWGKRGVAISQMGGLPATPYYGEIFQNGVAAIIPRQEELLSAIWAYCSSSEFKEEVRKLDQKLAVTNATLVKVPFDLARWQSVAEKEFPNGFPKPYSKDPTQWFFNGYPHDSDRPLQVAVARLLGYRWPRQTGSSFPDCPLLGADGLEPFVSDDGIVCLSALQGKQPCEKQLSTVLATAYGQDWPGNQQALLKRSGAKSSTIEDWLRDEFFAEHCDVFDNRPFIWHISDGLDQGFHALVNYHKLAEADGGGRRTLDKLTYTYLGDWIDHQRNQQKKGVAGSDARLASALHLQEELKKILAGETPYDIFVRWKPLHAQPIGWEPDINDGVRMNIRPFINARPLTGKGKNLSILRVRPGSSLNWKKDRGTEPVRDKKDFPWFWSCQDQVEDFAGGDKFDGNRWNDLHYGIEMKQKARAQHEAQSKKGQHA